MLRLVILIRAQKAKVRKVIRSDQMGLLVNLIPLIFKTFLLLILKLHTAHLPLCSLTNTMVSNIQLQILQVLLDGLYDSESQLSKLRMPAVKSPLMKIIWDKVTEDWQVISGPLILYYLLS